MTTADTKFWRHLDEQYRVVVARIASLEETMTKVEREPTPRRIFFQEQLRAVKTSRHGVVMAIVKGAESDEDRVVIVELFSRYPDLVSDPRLAHILDERQTQPL